MLYHVKNNKRHLVSQMITVMFVKSNIYLNIVQFVASSREMLELL